MKNLYGKFFFFDYVTKRGPLMNSLHASMMRHPNAIEAAQNAAPTGTQLVGQFVLHRLEDARERGSKESGLPVSELVVLGGHYIFKRRDGVQKVNDGWRVYARLQKATNPLRGGTNKDEPILPPDTQKYLRDQAEADERRRAELNGNGRLHVEATPPPLPIPEPEQAKIERRTLSLMETMKLVDWLRDNYEGIAKSGDTKVRVAETASKDLGVDISESTLHRIAKELNLDWIVVRAKSDHNASRTKSKVLARTIQYLFEKLGEKLPQDFIDEFGGGK